MLWIPNTLNLDPDPEFWPNLDPDPELYYQFLEKNFKIVIKVKQFYSN